VGQLHLVYRSTGGENQKGRPAFYSKPLCLLSFLRAIEPVRGAIGEIVFVNDGEIPDDRRELMRAGETVSLPSVGNSRSYRAALAQLDGRGWGDDDLVLFSEDDYLYRPNAIVALLAAGKRLGEVDYFTLYDHPNNYGDPELSNDLHRTVRRPILRTSIDGIGWCTSTSTCMSFAARVAALRADSWAHHAITTGPIPRDFALWLTVLGTDAFRVARWLPNLMGTPLEARAMARNVRVSLRPSGHGRRMLVGPRPALATHVQDHMLSPGVDWASIAADLVGWQPDQSWS
jgi:hypothetical protein